MFLNVADAAHQLPPPAVGIADHLSRERRPEKFRVLRPLQPELRVQVIRLAPERLHGPGPVLFIDITGVNKTAPIAAALPLSAHRWMVDHIQRLAPQVIGEEDVLGGFQRQLVALLLLQQDVLRLPLPFRQAHHHIVQPVDLQNVGGLEALQALRSSADAPHQLLDRPGQMPDHGIDPQHADAQAQQHGGHHPDIEAAAHAEQVLLRVQAHQHPLGVLVGYIRAVQPQGAQHGIDALVVQRQLLHPAEVRIIGFPQKELAARGAHLLIEHPLAHQGPVAAVPVPDGQQISGLL